MEPWVYDEYMSTIIEEDNFEAAYGMLERAIKPDSQISILDLCCGTGLFPRKWLPRLDDSFTYTGVDINVSYLKFARQELTDEAKYRFVRGDAGTIRLNQEFDLVLALSAYHHFPDQRKQAFLQNMKTHLKDDGLGIIYEKLVGGFRNEEEAITAGIEFYAKRIKDIAAEEELSEVQKFALFNEMYLTAVRKEEYKVFHAWLMADLKTAGLEVVDKEKVWPKKGEFLRYTDSGDHVISVRKGNS